MTTPRPLAPTAGAPNRAPAVRQMFNDLAPRYDLANRVLSLGLDHETAERDAEGIEHHVSERTLALFAAFSQRS